MIKKFILFLLLLLDCKPEKEVKFIYSDSIHHLQVDKEIIHFCVNGIDENCYIWDNRKGKLLLSDEILPIDEHAFLKDKTEELYLVNEYSEENRKIELRKTNSKSLVAKISFSDPEISFASGEFLGNSILISTAKCAGPCALGALYDKKGKFISKLGDDSFFLDGMTPLQLEGSLYAFNQGYGEEIIFQDIETGKIQNRIDLKYLFTEPSGCPYSSAIARWNEEQIVYVNSYAGNILFINWKKGMVDKKIDL